MRSSRFKWLVSVALSMGLFAGRAVEGQAVAGQWQPTWSDEFNTGQTDLAGWTHETGGGGWGNNEKEVYTTSTNNSFVSGGSLHIAAIATGTGTNQTYTSARIKTQNLFSQTYGLFEFRAKLPAGTGLWPALWMMPRDSAYGGWPRSGEIDILESKGQETDLVQGSLHTGTASNLLNTQTKHFSDSGLQPANFSTTDWHTYDFQWTAGTPGKSGTMTWYVDSVAYQTRTGGWSIPAGLSSDNKDAPFDQPFYIIMNLAVGGTYGGTPSLSPGTYEMQVDYVRTYQVPEPNTLCVSAIGFALSALRVRRRRNS